MRDPGCERQDVRRGMSYRNLEIWKPQLDLLGRKLNVFIETVERSHRTERAGFPNRAPRIAHLTS